ncbi:hypothetical protein BaRGS_00007925, partial [Batillaria attramentaria]
ADAAVGRSNFPVRPTVGTLLAKENIHPGGTRARAGAGWMKQSQVNDLSLQQDKSAAALPDFSFWSGLLVSIVYPRNVLELKKRPRAVPETKDERQETIDKTLETKDNRREATDETQQARDNRRETIGKRQ